MDATNEESSPVLVQLDDFVKSLPTYTNVYCRECGWQAATLTNEEAQLRGRIHDGTFGHTTESHAVVLVGDPPSELGYGDGG